MKDISKSIDYKGQTYKLVFNLNVMEQIQDEYGTIEKWGEMSDGTASGEPNIKAVKFGLTAMLNEGIEIDNDEKGEDNKPLTLKQVGRMISELGLNEITNILNSTVIDSTQSTEKNE